MQRRRMAGSAGRAARASRRAADVSRHRPALRRSAAAPRAAGS